MSLLLLACQLLHLYTLLICLNKVVNCQCDIKAILHNAVERNLREKYELCVNRC